MNSDATLDTSESPFHRGEHIVQKKLGVREDIERFGKRVIRQYMPQQHRDFYSQLPYLFVGHADEQGWPWASIMFDKTPFIASPNDKTLNIKPQLATGDPLQTAIKAGTRLGLLGIELPTRRRNRLAGHIAKTFEGNIELSVDQSFGNCPQYIQTRELEVLDAKSLPPATIVELNSFDQASRSLIQNSDTFFVASYIDTGSNNASEGADVSHRGGKPGFVRVDNERTLTIPDYPGNNHFNTFGNFVENGKAGLLFLDFEHGHVLTLTGTVEILWDAEEAQHFDGAERLWKFHIDHGRRIEHGLPLRWKMDQYSPNTLLTGTWTEAEAKREADTQRNSWQPYVVEKVVDESASIKSFYLKTKGHTVPTFQPGQFLTINLPIKGKDIIRTYTVSSAPADQLLRISVKRQEAAGPDLPEGLASNYLHTQVDAGDIIFAKAPSGTFVFDDREERPAVLLSAGVGITPMVAMAQQALVTGIRTRKLRATTLISAARNREERAFFDELCRLETESGSNIRSFWSLSQVDGSLLPGKDYHYTGRISAEFLQAVLPIDDYDFYLCGPSGFMQSTYDLLRDLGVNDARIFAESFGPASLQRKPDAGSVGPQSVAIAKQAIVEFSQSQVEQAWSEGDGSLLEFAENHGFSPEFACRSGQCGSCKTKLNSGSVSYQNPPAMPLEDDEILLCCAMPAAVEGEDIARLSVQL